MDETEISLYSKFLVFSSIEVRRLGRPLWKKFKGFLQWHSDKSYVVDKKKKKERERSSKTSQIKIKIVTEVSLRESHLMAERNGKECLDSTADFKY